MSENASENESALLSCGCFLSALDSIVQADKVLNPHWEKQLRKQVRHAVVIQGQGIITDSQLFDGAELLLLGPERFAMMVGTGTVPAAVFALRNSSAFDSLHTMRENSHFLWSSQEALGALLPEFDEAHFRQLQEDWALALDHGDFPHTLQKTENFESTISEILAISLASYGLSTADPDVRLLCEVTRRSEAIAHIATQEARRAAQLRSWWLNSYTGALSSIYDVPWLDDPDAEKKPSPPPQSSGKLRTSFPALADGWTTSLADIQTSDFAALVESVVMGRIGTRSRRSPTRPAIQYFQVLRIYLAIVQLSSTRIRPIGAAIAATARLLAWAALLLLAVGDALSWPAVSPLALVIVVILAAFAQFPWGDATHFWKALRTPVIQQFFAFADKKP